MNIEISKKEFRRLVTLLYLGEWMMRASDETERDDSRELGALVQKIYAFAKECDAEDLITHSKELDGYAATTTFEAAPDIQGVIEAYEEQSFWEMLINRLTDRDLAVKLGQQALADMGLEEYMEQFEPVEDTYREEFSEFGLERLEIQHT